ncbi:DNA polymerase-3 subunit epsilon [Clostridium cavendishii DSM 21758]|uniref:DNA polymerase-3 subunit epsilon n=1 Tax=Clostridium cavendishii DSM 21758 TaxID=1121302 RepID=A0A1M6F4H6_9CLOT|nr:3'-5' exonuclease [Clostridium cavendishii]SHI92563.1 DNA polymerase-3 subunit epsilon [Clostridium cavendishii DSM 21758]
MKLLFFDTETTGIRPGSICQLSYILVDSSTKPQTTIGKNFFFTVDFVEAEAEKVHGFSVERLYDLSNGMYFEDTLDEFYNDFIDADFVIGHNVQFDIKFLKHELAGMGDDYNPKNTFCTMNYYKNICKLLKANGEYKNPKLEELVKFLNISKEKIEETSNNLFEGSGNYHDARFDTAATYLTVIEGIKQKYIQPGYFTNLLKS